MGYDWKTVQGAGSVIRVKPQNNILNMNRYKLRRLIFHGGMAEWLKAPVSKAGNGATRSGVQIPLLRQVF